MKHRGPPFGGGPGADRNKEKAEQRTLYRSDSRRTSPTSTTPQITDTCEGNLNAQSIVITVSPAASNRGLYEARLGDRLLCSSRQPFFDAARVLVDEGCDLNAIMVMRHAGSNTDCLTAKVGK